MFTKVTSSNSIVRELSESSSVVVNEPAWTRQEFLGFQFDCMLQPEAVRKLLALTQTSTGAKVYFANAHSVEVAQANPALFQALRRSDLLLADGSGVLWGSRLLGKPLKHNLNGTDLVPALCRAGGAQGLSVYFLGAKPGVAERAAQRLAAQAPGMRIAGVQHGYYSRDSIELVLSDIRAAKPDILLVAMGTPLQEIWVDTYADALPGVVCMAVGGLFDFMAGEVTRAPGLVRQLGFEWVWRLLMEPKRLWKRYTVGNLRYLMVFLRYWMQSRLKPTM